MLEGESPSDKGGADFGNLDIADPADVDLQHISEIQVSDRPSSRGKGGAEDDMAEMEKLLKSGGAFGGKDLSNTFKKIRGELGNEPQDYEIEDESVD